MGRHCGRQDRPGSCDQAGDDECCRDARDRQGQCKCKCPEWATPPDEAYQQTEPFSGSVQHEDQGCRGWPERAGDQDERAHGRHQTGNHPGKPGHCERETDEMREISGHLAVNNCSLIDCFLIGRSLPIDPHNSCHG